MFKNTLLITALGVSAMSLSGCSSMWSVASSFSADMAEVTKFNWLRGKSKTSDISYAENNVDAQTGVYKTEVGEYVPALDTHQAVFADTAYDIAPIYSDFDTAAVVDSSQEPCPEGTYLTADNSCMSLDTESYDFAALADTGPAPFIDTSQHDCPEDTYLNDKNQCMYFETESFDFEDDVSFTEVAVDLSPLACPEDTYMTADGSCRVIDSPVTDFSEAVFDSPVMDYTDYSSNTAIAPAAPALRTAPLAAPVNELAFNLSSPPSLPPSSQCPKGFTPNGNSCMYVGGPTQ